MASSAQESSAPKEKGQRDIWSADKYSNKVAPFVAALTSKVVSWLDPQPDDVILDVGCGDGVLTAALAPRVQTIIGVDASPNMIQAFRQSYPSIPCQEVDCRFLSDSLPSLLSDVSNLGFTKVFSNAAFHWILRDPSTRSATLRACFDALQPGGVIVAEMGGMGNVAEVHAAMVLELMHRGLNPEEAREASPWYFPSLETIQSLLEGVGFEWVKGEMELRQTKLTEEGKGEGGIRGWLNLFAAPFLDKLGSDEKKESAVDNVVRALEAVGRRQHDNAFIVNYIRLRFVARKPSL